MKSSAENRDSVAEPALRNGKVKLAFQPIFDGGGGAFGKAEVLCRLESDGRIVMPDDFIPYAEKCGQIDALTRSVICELGRCAALPGLSRLVFSVNISPVQLKEAGFADRLCLWLREAGLPRDKVIFEITESVAYTVGGTVVSNLSGLKKHGFVLALDDFGKGASDLEKIALLPVGFIKIDKMYIDRYEERAVERMIRAVIGFAELSGKKCIAEGVETQAQWEALKRLRCHYCQGYYFSRPLYEGDFVRFTAAYGEKSLIAARGDGA